MYIRIVIAVTFFPRLLYPERIVYAPRLSESVAQQ